MLATKCPQCAAPVPLSLASPDALRCAFCGHRGTPPEAVVSALGAAAEVVAAHDASERQLRGALRALVVHGHVFQWLLGGLAAAVLGIVGLAMAVWLLTWSRSTTADPMGGIMALSVLPMALIVGFVSLVSLWMLRRATRRVAQAIGAVPPEREGEPSRCHVCGAPLESVGVRGVVRCAYCAADNVLARGAVAHASRERFVALEDYASEVARESGAVNRSFGKGTAAFTAAVVLTPFLCVIPTFFGSLFVWAVGKVVEIAKVESAPPTGGHRYGVVEVPGEGACVAWWNVYTGRWERAGGPEDKDAVPVPEGSVREVALADLVGRRVQVAVPGSKDRGFVGVGEKPQASIYVGPGGPKDFRVHAGADTLLVRDSTNRYRRTRTKVWGLCLVPEAEEATPRER